MGDNLTVFMFRLSCTLGASTSWNTTGLSRLVQGLLYRLLLLLLLSSSSSFLSNYPLQSAVHRTTQFQIVVPLSRLCSQQNFFFHRVYRVLVWYYFQILYCLLVAIPGASVTKLLVFHILRNSALKFLYMISFSVFFVLHSYRMVMLLLSLQKLYLYCF